MDANLTLAEVMATTVPFPEAVERVPMTERTLRKYVASGKLPAYRIGGRLRIDPADLDRLVQRVNPITETR